MRDHKRFARTGFNHVQHESVIPIEACKRQRYTVRMTHELVNAYGIKISSLLEEKFRARGTLERQVYKVGPKLPKRVRKALGSVLKIAVISEHPKLARLVDVQSLRKSGDLVIDHLEAIDPWDNLKGRILKWLGWVSGFAIIIFVVAIWYARQSGRI